MYIKEDAINEYFNEVNWKRSHQLYNEDSINSMSVVKIENYYQIIGSIKDNGRLYDAKVNVDNSGSITSFICSCDNFEEDVLACEHIGVLLLKFYSLELQDIPFTYNQESGYIQKLKELESKRQQASLDKMLIKTKDLIDDYRYLSNYNNIETASNIHITPVVETSFNRLLVNYKIGTSRDYIIKDLKEFIHNIKVGKLVSYSKNFVVDHDLSKFNDSAKAIINFISNNLNELIDRKTIKVNQQNIDDFFLCHLTSLSININFTTINLNNIHLSLKKDEEFSELELEPLDGDLMFGHRYLYYYNHKILNRYSKDISMLLMPLLSKLDNGKVIIDNNDLPYFSKYIFDQVSPYVNIEGDSIDEFLPNDILCLMYVDFNDLNELTVSLEYKDIDGETITSIDDYVLSLNIDNALDILNTYLEYDDITDMYFLRNEDDIYDFIINTLPLLNESIEVYVSEDIKAINRPKNLNLSIGVRLRNNLLEIDLDSINVDKEEIKNIILAFQNKKSYHRLKSGEFINLNDKELHDLSSMINDLNIKDEDLNSGTLYLDKYNSLYINQLIENNDSINFHRDDDFNNLIDHIKHVEKTDYPIPGEYQSILRDYQVTGYKWLRAMSDYGFGGILADDMGLGKTLQIISLFEANKEGLKLVITPATLILNWQDEIMKFSKDLKIMTIMGPLNERKKMIQYMENYDVIITSYDYIRKDYLLYNDFTFEYLIIDEAQYIKNQNTKNAKSVKTLKAKHRFALTGTPIENSLAELWSIFDFLMPSYLYTYSYFKEHFEHPIVTNNDPVAQEQLKKMVEPFILRRTKKDVLHELPDKIENNVKISFNESEEQAYLSNLSAINEDLRASLQVDKIDHIAILSMMTRLRQLCCDQRILYPEVENISSKMEVCLDIIKTAKENKQKVLLFSSFTTSLDLLEKSLQKEDISYYVLTGATNKIKRHQLVNAFQKDDTDVFLISLKAGGTGLNLTSASIVIHYDPWWNMSAQSQATDRAYRIGQTNNVQVFKLIMKNSIEEKIQELQNQKQNISNIFVENNSINISSLSTQDILDLFQ